MEPDKNHPFTEFYVTTTSEARRNFRIIMELFTIYFLTFEVIIFVKHGRYASFGYGPTITSTAFGLAIIMQCILLIKDFPTAGIYECMDEWHRLQLGLHFGTFIVIVVGIVTMSVIRGTQTHEYTVSVSAAVTSIFNATWYTISKIYENYVKRVIPAITVTDYSSEETVETARETVMLHGSFRGAQKLKRPVRKRQSRNFLLVPVIDGAVPIESTENKYMRFPSEKLIERSLNYKRNPLSIMVPPYDPSQVHLSRESSEEHALNQALKEHDAVINPSNVGLSHHSDNVGPSAYQDKVGPAHSPTLLNQSQDLSKKRKEDPEIQIIVEDLNGSTETCKTSLNSE